MDYLIREIRVRYKYLFSADEMLGQSKDRWTGQMLGAADKTLLLCVSMVTRTNHYI